MKYDFSDKHFNTALQNQITDKEDEEAIKHGCFVMVWPSSRKIFLKQNHHEHRNQAEDQG